MRFEQLGEGIAELKTMDRSERAEGVVELLRHVAELDAVATETTADFERSGAWALDGARNVVAWLVVRAGLSKREARRRVRLGRALVSLTLTAKAWRAGEVTGDQVGKIVSLQSPVSAPALERDEGLLVQKAKELRFEDFCKVADYWAQHADPDGAEAAAEARRVRRDVTLLPSAFGNWLGTMNLDDLSGAIVDGELRRIDNELFEADRAEFFEREGREATVGELARTPAQRRADALTVMATRSASVRGGERRPRPLFSVLVGYETLHGPILELAQGMALTPGSLVPWLTEADIERAVFTPDNRVEVSATARLFTGATRRALEIRDRRCTHPFCDVPAEECQGDHIEPWALGGLTTQENGRLLCGFHNRLRNEGPGPPPEEPQQE